MEPNNAVEQLGLLYEKVNNEYHRQIRNHIKDQLLEHLTGLKRQMAAFDDSATNSNILGDYLRRIREKLAEMEDIAGRMDEQFMLFIMGSGKNGKSTLINALLGQEKAEVNILPKTWKIDVYNDAGQKDRDTVVIRYKSGKKEKKTGRNEAEKIFSDEEKKQKDSQKKINEAVKSYKAAHSIDETEQFKARQNKYELYRSDIIEAVWNVAGSEILSDYSLVDTPGLRQELEGDMVIASAKDYYHKADGVIWLLPADKISGSTDRAEMDKLLKAYGRRQDNLIAVIGKVDKIGGSVNDVIASAKKLYGDIMTDFIPVSAKEAVEAKKVMDASRKDSREYKEAAQRLEQSGVPALIDHLKRTLYNRKSEIQLESKQAALRELCDEVRLLTEELAAQMEDADQKRKALEKNWTRDQKNIRKTASQNLSLFCDGVVDNIYNQVAANEDMLWDMEESARNRYIKNIVDPGHIESTIRTLVAQNTDTLEKKYAFHAQKSLFREFPDLEISELNISRDKNDLVKVEAMEGLTNEDDAKVLAGGALAAGAAIVLGPIGLAMGALAFTDVGKSVVKWLAKTFSSSIASKVRSKVNDQLETAQKDIMEQYDNVLSEAASKIEKIRNGSYEMLYGQYDRTANYITDVEEISDALDFDYTPLTLKEMLINGRNGR